MDDPRVLSIQSHVVHGYVGNRCALFPLQIAGIEVDTINSVQFSNHTGYGQWTGEILGSDQLWKLYEGLRKNSLNEYTHVLSGYTGSAPCVQEIAKIVGDLRSKNPKLKYICDPVMGDNGKFYVSEDVVPVYRDVILPLADVITPNQFELEVLSGVSISCQSDILRAMSLLHERGVRTVVVTSLNGQEKDSMLTGYGSQMKPDKTIEIFQYEVPRIDAYFVGTGDLFASLLLMWLYRTNDSLQDALKNVLASMQDVLKRTLEYARGRPNRIDGGKLSSKDLELRLIQSKDDLLQPRSEAKVTRFADGHL